MTNIKQRQEIINKVSEITILVLIIFTIGFMTISGIIAKNNVVNDEQEVVQVDY